MRRLIPASLALVLAASGICTLPSGAALAATRHVSYADLDLGTAAGRAAMDARLRRAATSVCLADNRELAVAQACRRDTLARARADLDRALPTNPVQLAAR